MKQTPHTESLTIDGEGVSIIPIALGASASTTNHFVNGLRSGRPFASMDFTAKVWLPLGSRSSCEVWAMLHESCCQHGSLEDGGPPTRRQATTRWLRVHVEENGREERRANNAHTLLAARRRASKASPLADSSSWARQSTGKRRQVIRCFGSPPLPPAATGYALHGQRAPVGTGACTPPRWSHPDGTAVEWYRRVLWTPQYSLATEGGGCRRRGHSLSSLR